MFTYPPCHRNLTESRARPQWLPLQLAGDWSSSTHRAAAACGRGAAAGTLLLRQLGTRAPSRVITVESSTVCLYKRSAAYYMYYMYFSQFQLFEMCVPQFA